MKYRHKFRAALLALAGLASAGLVRLTAEITVGATFPPLPAGAPAVAGKIGLVDFWASWCDPCRMSFPVYGRLQADYAARDLVIAAVSEDDAAAALAAFVKQQRPPFAVVRDQGHLLAGRVGVPAMPTCYLLDRDGRVRLVHVGFHGAETDRVLREAIDRLLADGTPSP